MTEEQKAALLKFTASVNEVIAAHGTALTLLTEALEATNKSLKVLEARVHAEQEKAHV